MSNISIKREFDHAALRDAMDRDHTPALLEALLDPEVSAAELSEIEATLRWLADPAAVPALVALLRDRGQPRGRRELAAGLLLSELNLDDALIPELFAGDEVEARAALLAMGHSEADLLIPVLEAPDHPLHAAAIGALSMGFDRPEYQTYKIRALSHPRAEVRIAAADALYIDEPAAAEEPLITALWDEAPDVASAAANTLRYYTTRRTLAALHARAQVGDEPATMAADAAWDVAADISLALEETPALADWAAPVMAQLEHYTPFDPPSDEAPEAPSGAPDGAAARSDPEPPRLGVEALAQALISPGGAWAPRLAALRALRPDEVPERARPVWITLLTTHPDREVRDRACGLLAAWGATEGLLTLLGDRSFLVMKSAMYHLGELPPDPSLAQGAWSHLDDPRVMSVHAAETVKTWAHHCPGYEALPRLRALAAADSREGVRIAAVQVLAERGDREGVAALLPELDAPPALSWGYPLALAWAARELGLTDPRLDALREVDQAHMAQVGVAP